VEVSSKLPGGPAKNENAGSGFKGSEVQGSKFKVQRFRAYVKFAQFIRKITLNVEPRTLNLY